MVGNTDNPNGDDFEILIFVSDGGPSAPEDPNAPDHALKSWLGRRVERVNDKVMAQWERTLDRLVQLSSKVGGTSDDWVAEEIAVGFTLSAKGELLFIAEAGATASITVKLKRRT